MCLIKPFLKMNQPKSDIVVDTDSFDFICQFMYDNDPACEYLFDKEYQELNGKVDKNELMFDIIDRMIKKHDRTRDCLLGANHKFQQMTKRSTRLRQAITKVVNSDKPNLWFITFTCEEKEDMNNARDEMKFYFTKHILQKNIKCAYSFEQASAESNRPHIHAIVEGEYFHTKKNLRPTKYYKGNINVKKIVIDNGTMNYISKENSPKGDVEYIKEKLSKL